MRHRFVRWRAWFVAGSLPGPDAAPASTLENFFPGLGWTEDLETDWHRSR